MERKRPPKDEYYLGIAKQIAQRSTCYRSRFGAIVVKEDVIVAAGYNGAPRKTMDCFERGECLRDKLKIPRGKQYELCRSVHAEQNCFINAARSGANVFGGDIFMYATNGENELVDAVPCFICKKMILNAGIKRVVSRLHDGSYKEFLVQDWVKDWQESDIIDDKYQYGADQNKRGAV